MTPSAHILAGNLDGVLWLRVSGRGSYEISPYLSRFATARIGAGVRQIVVDLEDCPVMDSTFMGTLTGIAVRLTELPGGRLQVVNPNERNRSLLSNLGLDQIFEVDAEGRTWQRERELISRMLADDVRDLGGPVAKREQCECMIEAHEALAQAQTANVPRFQDVIECLKREMQALPA